MLNGPSIGGVRMAGEVPVVSLAAGFENFGADRVDADAARHVRRGPGDEAVECAVRRRSCRAAPYRVAVGHSAGQRKRTVIVDVFEPFEHQVDLR